MKSIYIIANVLLAIVFSSGSGCKTHESDSKINADTIIKDIPAYLNDQESRTYFAKDLTMLGIKSIEEGYNDLQIRFWIGHGFGIQDSSQLIIIKKTGQKTLGELYTYKYPYESIDDSVLHTKKRIDVLSPRSGWETFLDSLQKMGIHDLPDYKKVPNYYLGADSFGVIVEIATPIKYRTYFYPDYLEHMDRIKEAAAMNRIMKFIEDEFKIRVIY